MIDREVESPVRMNAEFKEASLVAVPGPKERMRGDPDRELNSATKKKEKVTPTYAGTTGLVKPELVNWIAG
jgi:hypothetical protein